MNTPWGQSDSSKQIARGIVFYGTPSHGGIHVSPTRLAEMPDYLRNGTWAGEGWFEEDEDWARVAVAFPQFFPEKDVQAATDTLKNWSPDLYERHFGITLKPGESYKRDEKLFYEAHKDDWLVVAARGPWYEKAKPGYVYVEAQQGSAHRSNAPMRAFLVPEEEYDKRGRFAFVIDPARHEEVAV